MRKLGKILTWTMAFFFLPTLVGCGEGELEISSEDDMTMEYEQGSFDPACADLDMNGCVDVHDLNILLDTWGAEIACLQACGGCPDINSDGRVDGADLSYLLVAWGTGDSCDAVDADVGATGDDAPSFSAETESTDDASLSDEADGDAGKDTGKNPSFSASKGKG